MSDERRTKDDAAPDQGRDAASRLLDRLPPDAYLNAWKKSLRRTLGADDHADRFSVGVFRVGDELFAIPTERVLEVQPPVPIRPMPGRTNDVFRGLVSLRGEIHLCASLRALFGLEAPESGEHEETQRLLVVARGSERWALLVDEVLDFERYDLADVRGAQVTVSKAAVHFTDGVLRTPYGQAARIQGERLFEGLARSLA